ncbi:MAG: hypothetical protein ACO25B_03490 [Chitinophagaceae bacterium]
MKRIYLVLFSFIWATSYAQTAEEIIKQNADAMGGLEAFKNIQTARFTGSVSIQGNDFPLTIQIINGRAFRTDATIMEQAVSNVYKDGKGWKINPFAGITTPTDVEGTELNDFKPQANLASVLMDYKNLGHTAELTGEKDVEGIKTHEIKLTLKEDGRILYFYISQSDHLLLKMVSSRDIQGESREVVTMYSELKEMGGLKFFMTRDQSIDGQLIQSVKYSQVELNVPMDEKIFDK